MEEKAFILSTLKYGDSDAILHCYFCNLGYQSVFAKGVYSSRSRKKSFVFPLNELAFSNAILKPGKMISTTKMDLLASHYPNNDVHKSCLMMFVSDFLNQVLRDENGDVIIYTTISSFLQSMSDGNTDAHISLLFCLLDYAGLLPLVSDEVFLDPELGVYTAQISNKLFTEEVSSVWKLFSDSKARFELKLSRAQRSATLESLMLYYSYHYANFRIPESYEVMKDLYYH